MKKKLSFRGWVTLMLITPMWFINTSPTRKTWAEMKSGLIKHDHEWDYENPVGSTEYPYYKCKHFGCNMCTSILEKDGHIS